MISIGRARPVPIADDDDHQIRASEHLAAFQGAVLRILALVAIRIAAQVGQRGSDSVPPRRED